MLIEFTALAKLTFLSSCARYIFRICLGDGGSTNFPQISGNAPNSRHRDVSSHCNGDLSLCRPGRQIASSVICGSTHEEDLLWFSHPNGQSLPIMLSTRSWQYSKSGHCFRCCWGPCCLQVHLRPCLPRLRSYASTQLFGNWILGRNWSCSLDRCMDYCWVYSGLQWSFESYRTAPSLYF